MKKFDFSQLPFEAEKSALVLDMLRYICDKANEAHPKFQPAFAALNADVNAWLENQRR